MLVTQFCPTLCDPMDHRLPGSSVHEILQARVLVGCPVLLQGIFPVQGSNHISVSPALACGFFTTSTTWVSPCQAYLSSNPIHPFADLPLYIFKYLLSQSVKSC